MPHAAAKSSFDYSVFTLAIDDAGAVNVPVGVALWSTSMPWVAVRLIKQDEKLDRYKPKIHYPYIQLVQEKLDKWIAAERLPYGEESMKPHESTWWTHLRNILVHRVRISEPRPVDCFDPAEEIEPLYEAIVAPFRPIREQRSRVDGEIKRCLNGLGKKFRGNKTFVGFKGRPVRVLRSFEGPARSVAIEGVNLATDQADQQSDAIVSRLLRLMEGGRSFDLVVGYLAGPQGLNGEKVLIEWIQQKTGASTFDLKQERAEFRRYTEELVVKASMGLPEQGNELGL
jgi:hypothetical protein